MKLIRTRQEWIALWLSAAATAVYSKRRITAGVRQCREEIRELERDVHIPTRPRPISGASPPGGGGEPAA